MLDKNKGKRLAPGRSPHTYIHTPTIFLVPPFSLKYGVIVEALLHLNQEEAFLGIALNNGVPCKELHVKMVPGKEHKYVRPYLQTLLFSS